MCGISFIYQQPGNNTGLTVIADMAATVRHRGPDQESQCILPHVALGHTRLSIVDIRGGNQPMATVDGRYTIIYNGELYNYQDLRKPLVKNGYPFRTQSDTEVILALYSQEGAACLSKLRGMFAFVIYDRAEKSLFIARDRLGIKPMFYHWDGENLLGASEIKAILASKRVAPQFNPHTLQNYFSYQFNISPYTLFKGVLELPPGYFMQLQPGGKPQLTRYWDLPMPREGEYESLDEEHWLDEFENALNSAAETHVIGEVPIAAYLSGGIDSATTTHLLHKFQPSSQASGLESFTIQFGHLDFDEAPIAKQIAEHIGVLNHPMLMPDSADFSYLDQFTAALYHLEQAQRMAVDIPHFMLSKFVQERDYKVVYTGDGADEIFGGYDCFRQDSIRVWGNAYADMDKRWQYYLDDFGPYFATDYLQLLLQLHEPSRQAETIKRFGCYPAWYDFWQVLNETKQGLFSESFIAENKDNQQMEGMIEGMQGSIAGLHPLNQSLYLETKTRLPGWILWKSDRLSMAHSVEVRVPFMDHPLVEVAARMPPALKLNGMEEKYLLKQLMWPHLPDHPESYKKRAFYSPIRDWLFRPSNRQGLSVYLSKAAIEEAGVFTFARVDEIWRNLETAGQAEDYNAGFRQMQWEWALMLVLSVQILHSLFIKKNAIHLHKI